jgi:hypothetical protein
MDFYLHREKKLFSVYEKNHESFEDYLPVLIESGAILAFFPLPKRSEWIFTCIQKKSFFRFMKKIMNLLMTICMHIEKEAIYCGHLKPKKKGKA